MPLAETPAREFYKVNEVARIFGVTPQAVYKWIDEEKVKAVKLGSRATRIPIGEVERLRTQGLVSKNEPAAVTAG